jgi:hypothetical protein
MVAITLLEDSSLCSPTACPKHVSLAHVINFNISVKKLAKRLESEQAGLPLKLLILSGKLVFFNSYRKMPDQTASASFQIHQSSYNLTLYTLMLTGL